MIINNGICGILSILPTIKVTLDYVRLLINCCSLSLSEIKWRLNECTGRQTTSNYVDIQCFDNESYDHTDILIGISHLLQHTESLCYYSIIQRFQTCVTSSLIKEI